VREIHSQNYLATSPASRGVGIGRTPGLATTTLAVETSVPIIPTGARYRDRARAFGSSGDFDSPMEKTRWGSGRPAIEAAPGGDDEGALSPACAPDRGADGGAGAPLGAHGVPALSQILKLKSTPTTLPSEVPTRARSRLRSSRPARSSSPLQPAGSPPGPPPSSTDQSDADPAASASRRTSSTDPSSFNLVTPSDPRQSAGRTATLQDKSTATQGRPSCLPHGQPGRRRSPGRPHPSDWTETPLRRRGSFTAGGFSLSRRRGPSTSSTCPADRPTRRSSARVRPS